MNYFELVKKIAVLPGINLKEPQSFDTLDTQVIKIKNAVNQALRSVCSCWDWKFRIRKTTVELSADISKYEWNNGKILNVYIQKADTIPVKLKYMPDCTMFSQYGIPFCYTFESNNIIFYPNPNGDYICTIYYLTDNYTVSSDGQQEKAELVLATDLPIIPDKFQDLIIYKAALNFFSKQTKKEYPYYLLQYCERLVQAKSEDKGTSEDTPSIEIYGRTPLNRRF